MVYIALRRYRDHSSGRHRDLHAAIFAIIFGFAKSGHFGGIRERLRCVRDNSHTAWWPLMRWVFSLWAAPLVIFWGWYFLSLNDMHFGYVMLTRAAHDIVFQLYGEMLGIDPATIPWLVAKACIVDTFLLLALWAFRRRRNIAAWVRSARTRFAGVSPSPSA
jgi:hypothetical protein